MAHTVWNAAVAYATSNNAGTAALAAGGSETVTPILSNWLFKEKDSSKLTEDQKETLATINRLLGSGIGAAGGNADNALSDGLIARSVAEQNNMTRAGKGVVVPLFGALYCALDKHCGSVTDTFTGMMSEQIKSAQEEREKLFPILNDGKGGGEKAQVPKHPVSRSATGAPMPPDDEDNGKNDLDVNVNKILKQSNRLSNRNSLTQYEKNMPNRTDREAWQQAQKDFDSLKLQNIRTINNQYGQGRIGILNDGRTVIVRPGSSNGSPTLQINSKSSNKVIKIRY